MNLNDRIDVFLNKLKEDSTEYKQLEVSENIEAKKMAIRSLMNVRMPRSLSDELLKLQNDYLQKELQDKGIVRLSDIPTIKDKYGSRYPHADKISIWQGDITRLETDAIVNAANSQMLGCFVPCHKCVDNAIHSAAGMQLREECNRIMSQKRIQHGRHYEEPIGTAILTKGYNLPCHYVIHTVGPIVHNRLNDSLCQDLRNCYESILECCLEHGIKSIAFCCISTGEFHFPNEKAAKIAVETVSGFLENHENSCLERIIFNVFKEVDRDIYAKILCAF